MADKFFVIVQPEDHQGMPCVGAPADRVGFTYAGYVRHFRERGGVYAWDFRISWYGAPAPDPVYVRHDTPDLSKVKDAIVVVTERARGPFAELCAAGGATIIWADESERRRTKPYWRKLQSKSRLKKAA